MADVMMYDSDAFSEEDFVVDDDSDFDFDEENVAPKPTKRRGKAPSAAAKKPAAKKAAAAPKAKKKTSKKAKKDDIDDDVDDDVEVLAEIDDNVSSASSKASGKGGKTVEQMYQKKSQLEHILLRPDTYIGSVEPLTQSMYVLNTETKRIVQREITYTPGLYKIYDEILVNAADNKQRDANMDKLDIEIDPESNLISVKNNGQGIPVVMHKEHNCYVPTLIFGHLLTGSNFDDDEKKTTGGRNGYGAKLANIFSVEFTVECLDAANGKKFKQVFRDNMSEAEKPVVKKCTAAEKKKGDYTKISFRPDLTRFKMSSFNDDTVALLSKRAYDIAGSMANRAGKKLVVTLNGNKLPIKSFQTYLALYDNITPPSAYERVGERWEVGVSASIDGSFQQISFVNAICTSKGGGHTTYIADQVAKKLQAAVKKKNKGGVEIKANQIKNHLCVFVNCLVENPAFDSQTKENLTTRPGTFGTDCKLSDKFLKQVEKSGVIDSILAFAKFKQGQALKRKGGTKKTKLTGITKLDDANFAGGAKSKDCTLIITEGDSAKSLAMSGLSVVGRDHYGVFPLKGKPLNVREASHKQIIGNEEIKNVVEIMGLKFGTQYDESNVKTLRYGHLMIMADQDHDGSHIKGLVINFIHHFWPSLLDVPGFLQQFITPIVKATKKKKSHTFFTIPEYETWKESTGNDAKGYNVKYYKGLGTSTSAEAKEYFSNLDLHEVHFRDLKTDVVVPDEIRSEEIPNSDDDMDFEVESSSNNAPLKQVSGNELIEMAFSKKHVESRKIWLNNMAKDTYLNYSEAQEEGVRYSEFINKELILFSQADNQRSIPHVMDGFKPSQRKVLFSCFKRKLRSEIKVAQLAGYVSEHSAYHHGEASLNGTIVNMAQTFCGSNNINLLTPSGQFGTRRMGGKDAASPRYIFTKLENITRKIFHPDDDALLTYLNDDGLSIEPDFYMPVIPLVLVNGSEGIGTGWSSSVPNFNPRAIIDNIRRLIHGEDMEKMNPHYYGFTGEVAAETGKKAGSYSVKGRIERVNETTLHVSELPIKKWTQDYKVFLESFLTKDDKKKGATNGDVDIKDFKENHTDTTVSFTITTTKEKIDSFEKGKDGLYGKFKLNGSISTSNMNLFDERGRIIKYSSAESILQTFYELRLEFYSKRKEHLLRILRREMRMLSNKARFVEEVCSGDLVVSNRKRADILADLQERGYDTFTKDDMDKPDGEESDDEDEHASDAGLAKGYDYLLGMKIWSLTFEKAEQLRRELEEKKQAVADLEATAPSAIWENDLNEIEYAMDDRDRAMEAADKDERKAQSKNKKRVAKKAAAKKKGGRKKKANEWHSSDEELSEEEDFNSDSGDDFAPKKKAPARRRAPPARKPAAKKQAEAMAHASPVALPVSAKSTQEEQIDMTEESDEELDLMARMKQKLYVSPAPKKKAPRPAPLEISDEGEDNDDVESRSLSSSSAISKGRKRSSPRQGAINLLDDEDDEAPAVTSKASRPKAGAKKTAKKAPAVKKAPAAARKPRAAAAAKKPAPKKKKAVVELSESEDDLNASKEYDEDDDGSEDFTPPPPRARSGRARKQVNYALEDESDDDSDFSDFE